MKLLIAERRKEAADVAEQHELLDLYRRAVNGTDVALTRAPAPAQPDSVTPHDLLTGEITEHTNAVASGGPDIETGTDAAAPRISAEAESRHKESCGGHVARDAESMPQKPVDAVRAPDNGSAGATIGPQDPNPRIPEASQYGSGGTGMKKLRVVDLFSGTGAMSLGLERTNEFETVLFCEIDAFCRRVIAKHWPDVPCHDDVTTLDLPEGFADVVAGGFPCQDVSCAGKRAGITGERSGLYRELVRTLRMVRPRYGLLDNVAAECSSVYGLCE